MTIKLRLLDKLDSFAYDKTVPFFLDTPNNCIGECLIFRDNAGKHFGELTIETDIPGDHYLYYVNRASEFPVFYLTELLFLDTARDGGKFSTFNEVLV